MRKRVLRVFGLGALALLLTACAPHASQDSLKPAGPYAREIKNLFVPVFWVAAAVFFIVEGGIVWLLIRYRHRKGREVSPPQIHGNTRLEIGWTILPALVLAVVMVPTVATIWDLAGSPPAGSLHVTVQGYQWWWGFEYTDTDMKTTSGGQITVGDVMVIPAARPVYLSLESIQGVGAEVIHSFWVPQLAGKQDVIPLQANHILLQADHPGVYYGQCAEFCGLSHGIMRFRVQALSAADWLAWVADQKRGPVTPTDPTAKAGMDFFLNGACIACHTIDGTSAQGIGGPNLTHFADPAHSCFAGCLYDTFGPDGEQNLRTWLTDPPAVKPGSKMPNYHLTSEQIDQLVAYLHSLT